MSGTAGSSTYRDYPISTDAEREERRLAGIEARYDPTTKRLLTEAIGIRPGWRCLELGPGRGSITAWMAEQVGDTGHVTAVDMDMRFISRLQLPNVEIREADLRDSDVIETDTYDLAHTRALLMHLEARDEILDQLVASLRPGGWVLIEEGDGFPTVTVDKPAIRNTLGVMFGRFEWARGLPERLVARGLADVGVEVDTSYFQGGSAEAELWQQTLARRVELMEPGTFPPDDVAEANEILSDPNQWVMVTSLISAWGRRPA
jgi:SAM-dependent methyltransferase